MKHIDKLKGKAVIALVKNVKMENSQKCKEEVRRV